MKMDARRAVLAAMGLDYELLDSGCCGMAGAFGFERGHYDVSVACGERVLLPAVRGATRTHWSIANGFSCREQIAQTTDRRALHLAEVLRMAVRARTGEEVVREVRSGSWLLGAAALGGAAVLGGAALRGVAQALHSTE